MPECRFDKSNAASIIDQPKRQAPLACLYRNRSRASTETEAQGKGKGKYCIEEDLERKTHIVKTYIVKTYIGAPSRECCSSDLVRTSLFAPLGATSPCSCDSATVFLSSILLTLRPHPVRLCPRRRLGKISVGRAFFSERALDSGREVSQVVLCRVALQCSGSQ